MRKRKPATPKAFEGLAVALVLPAGGGSSNAISPGCQAAFIAGKVRLQGGTATVYTAAPKTHTRIDADYVACYDGVDVKDLDVEAAAVVNVHWVTAVLGHGSVSAVDASLFQFGEARSATKGEDARGEVEEADLRVATFVCSGGLHLALKDASLARAVDTTHADVLLLQCTQLAANDEAEVAMALEVVMRRGRKRGNFSCAFSAFSAAEAAGGVAIVLCGAGADALTDVCRLDNFAVSAGAGPRLRFVSCIGGPLRKTALRFVSRQVDDNSDDVGFVVGLSECAVGECECVSEGDCSSAPVYGDGGSAQNCGGSPPQNDGEGPPDSFAKVLKGAARLFDCRVLGPARRERVETWFEDDPRTLNVRSQDDDDPRPTGGALDVPDDAARPSAVLLASYDVGRGLQHRCCESLYRNNHAVLILLPLRRSELASFSAEQAKRKRRAGNDALSEMCLRTFPSAARDAAFSQRTKHVQVLKVLSEARQCELALGGKDRDKSGLGSKRQGHVNVRALGLQRCEAAVVSCATALRDVEDVRAGACREDEAPSQGSKNPCREEHRRCIRTRVFNLCQTRQGRGLVERPEPSEKGSGSGHGQSRGLTGQNAQTGSRKPLVGGKIGRRENRKPPLLLADRAGSHSDPETRRSSAALSACR